MNEVVFSQRAQSRNHGLRLRPADDPGNAVSGACASADWMFSIAAGGGMAASAAASLHVGHQRDRSPTGGALAGSRRDTQRQPPVTGQVRSDSDLARAGAGTGRLTKNSVAAEPAEGASGNYQQPGHVNGIGMEAAPTVQPPRRRVSFANKLPAITQAPRRRSSGAGGGEARDGARVTAEWVAAQASCRCFWHEDHE